jgi:hypothetical protein
MNSTTRCLQCEALRKDGARCKRKISCRIGNKHYCWQHALFLINKGHLAVFMLPSYPHDDELEQLRKSYNQKGPLPHPIVERINNVVGNGVFADRDYQKGEILCWYDGEIIHLSPDPYSQYVPYPERFYLWTTARQNVFISGLSGQCPGSRINSATRKNSTIQLGTANVDLFHYSTKYQKGYVTATKNIKQGQQLLGSYGSGFKINEKLTKSEMNKENKEAFEELSKKLNKTTVGSPRFIELSKISAMYNK